MGKTLTYAEICALPAGRQLDALVAAELQRGERSPYRTPPTESRWSSDARLACRLIAELTCPFFMVSPWTITVRCHLSGTAEANGWTCTITGSDDEGPWLCEATGDTLPLAFCRAFLECREEPSHG